MRVEIGIALRFQNLLKEATRVQQDGHDAKAAVLLDQARALIAPPAPFIFHGRPEDDPTRSEADREAWRDARGA